MAGGESGRSAEPSYGRGSRATILGQHGKVWVQGLSMRLLLSVALATFVGLAAAHGQVYPSRPVTMIVPFPAGGSTDAIARILAERMRVSLGQPVVIENVGGAGGSIGVGRVARAAPDGYTLDVGQWDTHVANGATFPLSYDVVKDFEPVALLSSNPFLILAKKAMPADDLKGLVTWLKANPDKASQAIPTAGSHVAGILFQKETGTRFAFVPYRGGGPAMQDLVAGQIDLMIIQAAVAVPQVRAGAIKAYAVTTGSRFAAAPDIPTVDEAGLPGIHISGWFALVCAQGDAQARHRHAQRRGRGGARRCGRACTARHSRPGDLPTRATDAGGARRLPQ